MDRKTAKKKSGMGTGAQSPASAKNRFRVIYGTRGAYGRDARSMYDTRGLSAKGKNGLESLKRRSSRRRLIILSIFAGTAAVFAAAFLFILQYFHVENIYVEGNLHYTSEEIIDMVTGERFGDNSLYLSLKYRNKGVEGIPFIQTMDVDVLSPDTIRIVVYEKTVAGYVEYLDRYMYFDRDGIVVEASETKTEGIPEIAGIEFSQVVLYEPLPVENGGIFREILSITQILSKYGLSADKIYFDDTGEMTLYFGEVRARPGFPGASRRCRPG